MMCEARFNAWTSLRLCFNSLHVPPLKWLASAQLIRSLAVVRVLHRIVCGRKCRSEKNKELQDFKDIKEGKRARASVTRGQSCLEPFLLFVPFRIKAHLIHACLYSFHQQTLKMLQLLTFLVEKISLLSQFKLFEPIWSDGEDSDLERHAQRGPPPPLRRGDLLEVPRSIFTHYGIYLGDHKVAHLIPDILPVLTNNKKLISSVITNKRLIIGCIYKSATVRVDTLEDFAYGSKIMVNRMDRVMKNKAFPNEDVAKRAEKLIGAIPYSLLWNNCEHFATYCRYGSAASRQTEKVWSSQRFCKQVQD